MEDLRLVAIQDREGMSFGIKETVGALVGGGILMMVGLYAYSKVGGKIDFLNGGTAMNATHYCPVGGGWNGTNCVTGTPTLLPSNYAQDVVVLADIKSNITSGFDIGSIVFIIIAIVSLLSVLWMAFN